MIAALDLGSTAFKAAVYDRRLRLCGLGRRLVQHRFGSEGQVELEIEEAETAAHAAVRQALRQAAVRPSSLDVLALTSQAQTFTVTDPEGQPRRPFISWQDARATPTGARLERLRSLRDFGRHCSFGTLLPALQMCQLRHLHETEPGFVADHDRVVNLPTFLLHRWTGTVAVDENLAAMSGLYSMVTRSWWPVALRLCGLREAQLAALVPIGAVAGRTREGAKRAGLPEGIPVVLAGNDQTAGAYAARLDQNHGLLVTLGTAQVAYAYAGRQPRPHPALVRGPFPGGGYYRMLADSFGGNLVNWAKGVLAGCGTDEAFFDRAGRAAPGCAGLRFNPGHPDGRPAWHPIGFHHTAADFARSVLEFLVTRLASSVRELGLYRSPTAVFAAGGGSASPLWVRLLSEALGTRVTVTDAQPLLGAARMATASVL